MIMRGLERLGLFLKPWRFTETSFKPRRLLSDWRSWRRLSRSRVAFKLKNDRINKITFHTFRHWKATMEYAKTKDILHVMKILGHKSIQSTLLYTQLVNFESDDYHSATAKSVEEAQKLVEAGFEYVCDFDETKLFRKRK